MPFSQFSAFYNPETLALLTGVFDDAWPEFHASFRWDNETVARELLAARIIQAYGEGQRAPSALKAAALRGLAAN